MAKIYGALESAQIEWFTNAGKPAASNYPYRVIYVTDLKQIQISDGTNWNPSALYTYTAATLPAAGASNQNQLAFITDTLQVKVSDGSQWKTIGARLDTFTNATIPSASTNANSMIWVSDLQQVQVSNGTSWVQVGSKAGTKNYFAQNNANPDFETNSVSPWSACTLTFSGGAPTGAPTLTATQMAISTTASSPLSGTYSMLLTKSAANAQNQGFISAPLTIDRQDAAKVLYGSFYYEVVSGTIDLSGTSTQSLEIWIYNTVSGQWTQPAGYRGMNQSIGTGRVVFSFQTDGTFANNSYRIAVITQQTSTSAFVVEFDDFQVGPESIVLGAAMTDWQSYTPTFTGFGTTSNIEFQWRRVGSDLEVRGKFTLGTVTATEARISFPTGLTSASSTQIPSLTVFGTMYTTVNPSNISSTFSVLCNSSLTYFTFGLSQSTFNGSLTSQSAPTAFSSGSQAAFFAKVPIAGWGSFSQVSNDTDTRVVAASYRGSGTQSGNNIDLTFTTREIDTHAAFSSTTFTTPVSGQYNIGTVVRVDSQSVGNNVHFLDIYVNGSQRVQIGYTPNFATAPINTLTGTAMVQLNAGDTVTIRASNSGGSSVTYSTRNVSIHRLSGSSVITATETVACRYTNTSGQAIAQNTNTTLTNWTRDYDTHSFFSGSTGVATIPVSGKFTVNMSVLFSSGAFGSASQLSIMLDQAGSITRTIYLGSVFPSAAGTNFVQINGSETFNALAGDTVTVRVFQNTGAGTRSLDVNGSYTHIAFTRVGN